MVQPAVTGFVSSSTIQEGRPGFVQRLFVVMVEPPAKMCYKFPWPYNTLQHLSNEDTADSHLKGVLLF